MSLTDKQKVDYERDGFVIYGPLLSEETLEALREQMDALADGSHPNAEKAGVRLEAAAQRGELENVPRRDKVWQLLDPHRYDEVIFDHASNPNILDIVCPAAWYGRYQTIPHPDFDETGFPRLDCFLASGLGLLDFRGPSHTCELLDSLGRRDRRERLPAVASRQL